MGGPALRNPPVPDWPRNPLKPASAEETALQTAILWPNAPCWIVKQEACLVSSILLDRHAAAAQNKDFLPAASRKKVFVARGGTTLCVCVWGGIGLDFTWVQSGVQLQKADLEQKQLRGASAAAGFTRTNLPF